jgi:hypothetical protein
LSLFQFSSLRSSQEIPSLKLQTFLPELSYTLGANRSILSKFHSNRKFQEEILLNSKPRSFNDFLFEIHFKSREVPMETVVPFFKFFTTIFYFNFFEVGKALFGSNKVLNEFELNSKSFESF